MGVQVPCSRSLGGRHQNGTVESAFEPSKPQTTPQMQPHRNRPLKVPAYKYGYSLLDVMQESKSVYYDESCERIWHY